MIVVKIVTNNKAVDMMKVMPKYFPYSLLKSVRFSFNKKSCGTKIMIPLETHKTKMNFVGILFMSNNFSNNFSIVH